METGGVKCSDSELRMKRTKLVALLFLTCSAAELITRTRTTTTTMMMMIIIIRMRMEIKKVKR